MLLSILQKEFVLALALLITRADDIDCYLTLGDGYRDSRQHGDYGVAVGYGAARSNHKIRLAQDYNLFCNGEYITDSNHPKYKLLGEYWESLHPFATWGGRFNDANHFSFRYGGHR